jgi:hypothetical protein
MHHRQGSDCVAAYAEWGVVVKLVYVECWHSGIEIFAKAVGHAVAQVVGNIRAAVYIKFSGSAVWAHIVYAANMVIVGVCEQGSGESRRAGTQHLHAKVGAAVYQEIIAVVGFEQC